MSRIIVFLGPSLPLAEARAILDADYHPPVRQGDIMRALRDRPSAIAIIDGVFRNEPSVRHRECLFALSFGIPVFGASSMGALRASELDGNGMVGVGLIYRWYRRHVMAADDAVALNFGPSELGSPSLNDTLIDIRMSLKAARRAGAILRSEEKQLNDLAAYQLFGDRNLAQLGSLIGRDDLNDVLSKYRVGQKSKDARALLRKLECNARSNDWPKPATPRPPIVDAWLDDLRDGGLEWSEFKEKTGSANG